MDQDHNFLDLAFEQARKAAEHDEVPVGAIIVKDNELVASAFNLKESENDPTAHAEVLVIRKAAQVLGTWRLQGCILYSTLEPCPMCAGAIIQARIRRVVFGAKDEKWGAAGTKIDLFQPKLFNHDVSYTYIRKPSFELELTQFFKKLR